MATDVAMIDALAGPLGPSQLTRVFSWANPAVSFGRSRPPAHTVSDRLAGHGIEAVVRPTGGAVLLHGPGLDVSFSGAVRRLRGSGGVDLVEQGRNLASPVLEGLRVLGIEAEFRECDACGSAGENARLPLCFLQKTPFDILVAGRKVASFALRRTAHVIFLHGSVLIGEVPGGMIQALIDACVGTEEEWRSALAGIGHIKADASHVAEAIATSS